MSARYVQKGESIDYRPETDVRAKTIVPFPGFVGITRLDIRAGELGALAVTGVFESPKADEAIDVGDPVYWDEANEVATKQKTDVYLGVAVYNLRRARSSSTSCSMPGAREHPALPAAPPPRLPPSPISERSRAIPDVPPRWRL